MSDSRFASISYLKKKWPISKKVSLLIFVSALAYFLTQLLRSEDMTQPQVNALFLLLLAAGLWISEAIPPFAVSILIIGFSVYFIENSSPNIISPDWQKYTNSWSSQIIWILLGGFFLAIGAQITNFDKRFSKVVLTNFGSKPQNLLLGSMLVTGILSMFMSNTATTAMMISVITPITSKLHTGDPYTKALFLGVAIAATIGGMGTIIGSPPNAIAVGIINNQGIEFGFLDWMLLGVPVALIIILASWIILINVFKAENESLVLDFSIDPLDDSNRNTVFNRAVVVTTFILTIGLWLTSMFHNIPVAVISLLPILIFTVTGVVNAKDLRLIPWDTLILVAGGLTLGIVLKDTGLAESLVGNIPTFKTMLISLITLCWITTILSNIMSNTAAASILIPVGVSFFPEQILVVCLCLGLSASTALFLPISTPPNAIVFSNSNLEQKDFRLMGAIIGLGGPIVILCLTYIILGW